MPCLFAMFAGLFPRFASLFIWLARPVLFTAAFGGSWFLPILGILFLPLSTLFYVILWTPGVGLSGFDWFWVFLALLLDISSYATAGYSNRDRIPGYSGT